MVIKGEKIRELREERGYSLQDFAGRASISVSYLSEIERGFKKPSLKTLERIAQALNISKTQLVEIDGQEDRLALGERVRLIREDKNISLTELARIVDISVSYLSEIERGNVQPAVNTLRKIAESLEVSPSNLIGREGSIGYRLRSIREEFGLTQAELAGRAGVSAGLIGQIELGKVQPSLKTVEKIATVLGTSPCYFILDQAGTEQVMSNMSPDLRELLMHPNVKAVLRLICNLNEKELRFILDFIQLYKRSGLS